MSPEEKAAWSVRRCREISKAGRPAIWGLCEAFRPNKKLKHFSWEDLLTQRTTKLRIWELPEWYVAFRSPWTQKCVLFFHHGPDWNIFSHMDWRVWFVKWTLCLWVTEVLHLSIWCWKTQESSRILLSKIYCSDWKCAKWMCKLVTLVQVLARRCRVCFALYPTRWGPVPRMLHCVKHNYHIITFVLSRGYSPSHSQSNPLPIIHSTNDWGPTWM